MLVGCGAPRYSRKGRERYVIVVNVVNDRNLPRPIARFLFAPTTRRLLRLLPPTPPCFISILPDEVTRHRACGRLYLCQVTIRCCVRPVHSVPRAVVLHGILHPVHAPTHFSPIQIATPSLPTSHLVATNSSQNIGYSLIAVPAASYLPKTRTASVHSCPNRSEPR